MQKIKRFKRVKFNSRTFYAAHKQLESLASSKIRYSNLSIESGGEEWKYDTIEEFLAAADTGWATFQVSADKKLSVYVIPDPTEVTSVYVEAPTREEIEKIASVFEREAERCRLPEPPPAPEPEVKVFIGHGADPQWKDLKDHLHEKHGYAVEAYEIGSRSGHAIRDILEEMLKASSFALLVMTGEDETKDGKILARQNVVHEAGLFQGRLGFGRAIIILEDGTEEFSNIAGLQQIRFSKGKIRETFGDVLAVLERELG
ncbi:MAG: nucleotide-binding protein [Candidatus Acidiferrales bacterium]